MIYLCVCQHFFQKGFKNIVTVQPYIFLPAYSGQETFGVRLAGDICPAFLCQKSEQMSCLTGSGYQLQPSITK